MKYGMGSMKMRKYQNFAASKTRDKVLCGPKRVT